jgi:hypothetical protein
VPDATFACPDLTTFARLDELGLEVVGSGSSRIVLCWRAGSSSRTSGAAAADAGERIVTPWSGGWRTSRSGGGRRR